VWCCQCASQTIAHLFKVCPEWRMEKKILCGGQKKAGKRVRGGLLTVDATLVCCLGLLPGLGADLP